jgi:hypothetical protein
VVTPTRAAQAFYDLVDASLKRFALIRNAGHFAAFLEPDQFLEQLLFDVRPLAETSQTVSVAPREMALTERSF